MAHLTDHVVLCLDYRDILDRRIWIGKPSLAERMHLSVAGTDQPSTNGTAIASADSL